MAEVRFISFSAAYYIIDVHATNTSASNWMSSSRLNHSASVCPISEQSVTDSTNTNNMRNIADS